MIRAVEINEDTIRYHGRIIARVSPTIPLSVAREFEDFLAIRPDRENVDRSEMIEQVKLKLLNRFEIENEIVENLREAFPANGGLFTADEIKRVITDYLSTSD